MEHNMMLEQISDWIIAIAYFGIPIELVYFLCRQGLHPIMHDLRARVITGLFAAFILLCGTTHAFNAVRTNLVVEFLQTHGQDVPTDALATDESIARWAIALHVAKVLTALVSVATVLVLIVIMPPILAAVASIPKLEEGLRSKIFELHEARSLAEEANTRKGEFMSFLCHEIRNPLHVIMANLDFLLESTSLPQQQSTQKALMQSMLNQQGMVVAPEWVVAQLVAWQMQQQMRVHQGSESDSSQQQSSKDLTRLALSRDQSLQPTGSPSSSNSSSQMLSVGASPLSGTTPLSQPQMLRPLSDPALASTGYPLYPISDSADVTVAPVGLTPFTMTPASGAEGGKRRTWPSMSASSSSGSLTASSPCPVPAHLLPHLSVLLLPGPGHLSLQQRQYLKAINHAAELMVSLCNDVLDIAKLESGVIVFDHLAVDLPLLCETFVSLSRPQAMQKNIDIALVWDAPPLPSRYVFCDPTRLHQVFLQLLSNAIKFSKTTDKAPAIKQDETAPAQAQTEEKASVVEHHDDLAEHKTFSPSASNAEEDARARLERNLSSIFNEATASASSSSFTAAAASYASSRSRAASQSAQQPQHAPPEIKFRVRAWYPDAAGSASSAAAVDPSHLGADTPVPPARFSPPLSASTAAALRRQQQPQQHQSDAVLHRGSVISVVNSSDGKATTPVDLTTPPGGGDSSNNHSPDPVRRPLLAPSQQTGSDDSPQRQHTRTRSILNIAGSASASSGSLSSQSGGSPSLHSLAVGSTTPPLHPLSSRHAAASVPLPSPQQGGSSPFTTPVTPSGTHLHRGSGNGNGPRSMPPLVPRASLAVLANMPSGAGGRVPQSPGVGSHLQPQSNKPGSYGSARSSGSGSLHGLGGARAGPPRLDEFQAALGSSSSSINVSASGSEGGDDPAEREIGERVHLIDIHGGSTSPPIRSALAAGSVATPRFPALASSALSSAMATASGPGTRAHGAERMVVSAFPVPSEAARARAEAAASAAAAAADSLDDAHPQFVWVEFEVSDNGVGMAARQLEHIFTPYSETKLKTYRSRGGTGLGLSICREIVNQLEGEMFVTSKEGEGSTFVVRLRFQVAKQSDVLEAYFQDQEDPSQPPSAIEAAQRSIEAQMQMQMQEMPAAHSETAAAATITTVAPAATSLDLLSSPLFEQPPSNEFALPASDHTQFAAAAPSTAGASTTAPGSLSVPSLPASGSAISSRESSSSAAAHFAAMFRPHMNAAELGGGDIPQTGSVLLHAPSLMDPTISPQQQQQQQQQLHLPFVPAVQPSSAGPTATPMSGLASASPQSAGANTSSSHLSFPVPSPLSSVIPSEVNTATSASVAATHVPTAAARPRWRLLVVDDNEINRKLLSRMMRSLSYEVDVAEDGLVALEAVRANMAAVGPPPPPLAVGADAAPEDAAAQERRREYEANRYCCIIMDLSMPVMDGYESTTAIRALGFTAPIIALTANALSEERAKALAAGCDEFCTKPIRKHELVQLMKHFCGHEQGAQHGPAAAGATGGAAAPAAAALPVAGWLGGRQTSSPSPGGGRLPSSHSHSSSAVPSPAVHSVNSASIGLGSLHLASTQPYAIGLREGTPTHGTGMSSSAASSSSPSPMGSSHRGSGEGQHPHFSLPGSPRSSGQGMGSSAASSTTLPASSTRLSGSRVSSANSNSGSYARPPLSVQGSSVVVAPSDASANPSLAPNPNRGSSGTPRHFKDRGSSERDPSTRGSGGSSSYSPQPPFASRSVSAAATPLGGVTPRELLTDGNSKRGGSDGLPDSASSTSSGGRLHLASPSQLGVPRASPPLASPSGGSMNLRRQLMQERGYSAAMAAEASAQGLARSPRRVTLEPKNKEDSPVAVQHPQQSTPEFATFDSDRSASPVSSISSSASPPALSAHVPFTPISTVSGGVGGGSDLSPPSQTTSLRPPVHQRTRSRGAINVAALVGAGLGPGTGAGATGAGGVDHGLLSAIRVQQEMQQKQQNSGPLSSIYHASAVVAPSVSAASSFFPAAAGSESGAASSSFAPVRPVSAGPSSSASSSVLRLAPLEQVNEEGRDPSASPRSATTAPSP